MDKNYYTEYFLIERNHWWFIARSEILSDYVKKNIVRGEPIKILNVGVATGATSEMLSRYGLVDSLEYEQDCIDFIRDKVSINVVQGSILELPFPDNSFDLVCAFDVIEHVEDDSTAAKELSRVCRPTGSVLITVPAFMSLWGEHDEINHHHRRYTLNTLRTLFQAQPGVIRYSSYFNFFLFPPIFATRKIANIFRRKSGQLSSDFQKYKPGTVAKVLYRLFKSERVLLSRFVSLPFGVSAILHWQKD